MTTYMKLTEYIELRLENNKTMIYVDGQEFIQCKYLLINVDTTKPRPENQLDSIDELKDYYSNKLEGANEKELITPEVEFFGHCSNLQAWVEHDYNPNLLHSNLSVPLLEKLIHLDIKVFSSLMFHLDDMFSSYENSYSSKFTYQRKMNLIERFDKVVKYAVYTHKLEKYASLSKFWLTCRLLDALKNMFPFTTEHCEMCETWKPRIDSYHNGFIDIRVYEDPFDLDSFQDFHTCPECFDVLSEYNYENCGTCGNLFDNSYDSNVRFVETYEEYMCNYCLSETLLSEGVPHFREFDQAKDLTLSQCENHNWHYLGTIEYNER